MPGLAPAEQSAAIAMAARAEKANILAITGLTAEQTAVVDAMTDYVNAKNGEDALGVAITEFTRGNFVNDGIDVHILSDVDVSGKPLARAATETTESTNRKAEMVLLNKYMLDGYDALNAGDQAAMQGHVDLMIRSVPAYFDALKDGGGYIPVSTMEALLKDKVIRNALATSLNEAFDPAKIPSEMRQKLVEAKAKVAKAGTDLTAAALEKTTADTAKTTTDTAKTNFETSAYASTNGITGGNKEEVFQNIQVNSDVSQYIGYMDHYGGNYANMPPPVKKVMGALMAKNVVIEYMGLKGTRDKVNTDATKAAEKVTSADGKITTLKAGETTAKTEEANAILALRTHSSDFNVQIQAALRTSLNSKLTEKVKNNLTKFADYKKEALSVTEQKNKKLIEANVASRWITSGKLDGKKAAVDYKKLLAGGPDALIKQILTDATVPAGEIDALMNDQNFMNLQRTELSGKMLQVYLSTGHQITEAESKAMSMASWSKDVISGYVANNTQAKAFIKSLEDNGVLKKGSGPTEWFNGLGRLKWIILILLALGLVVPIVSVLKP